MTRLTDEYLAQLVNYGGEWTPLATVIDDLGAEDAMTWLAGYLAGQRIVLPGPKATTSRA